MAEPADIDPTAQSSNVHSKSRAGFVTYEEYIKELLSTSGAHYYRSYQGVQDYLSGDAIGDIYFPGELDGLDVFRIYDNGTPASFHRLGDVASDADLDTELSHSYTFRDRFSNIDNVTSQVVILRMGHNGLPDPWVVDTVSMILDLDPAVWSYFSDGERSARWFRRDNFIEIGEDALMILGGVSGVRPKTAIMFLRQPSEDISLGQSSTPYAIMYPADSPSVLAKHKDFSTPNFEAMFKGNAKTCALYRWIYDTVSSSRSEKVQDPLFACLQALLHFQRFTASYGVALLTKWDGQIVPRYDALWKKRGKPEEPQSLWHRLRDDVDERRTILHNIPEFVRCNFNTKDPSTKELLEQTKNSYEKSLRELEIAEARLKDQIDIINMGKSTEMAQLSIQESKRVMLLTILAFIFVPVSLASSIFGMNVQQINSSGHSIKAFVITAIVLLLVSFLLWAVVSAVVAYRNHRIAKWNLSKRNELRLPLSERPVVDKVLLVGVELGLDSLKFWSKMTWDDFNLWKRWKTHKKKQEARYRLEVIEPAKRELNRRRAEAQREGRTDWPREIELPRRIPSKRRRKCKWPWGKGGDPDESRTSPPV